MQISFSNSYFLSSLKTSILDSFTDIKEVGEVFLVDSITYVMLRSLQVGFENPVVGKLMSGTICTGQGMLGLIKSQVPQSVLSFFKQKVNGTSTQNLPSPSGKQKIIATFSMLTLMYGICEIYSGIYEILSQDSTEKKSLDLSYSHPQIYFPDQPSCLESTPSTLSSTDIEETVNMLNDCSASRDFLENLDQNGLFEFSIIPENQIPDPNFQASCSWPERVIYLRESLSKKKILPVLLFELLNSSRVEDLQKLIKQGYAGHISRETYVQTLEKIENENRIIHHQIVQECMKTNEWPSDADVYEHLEKDFTLWWKKIKFSYHAERFRKEYDKFFLKSYCKKHPETDEC